MVFEPIAVPLTEVEGGQLRVTGTRIPLESIVRYYCAGASIEEILLWLPTLKPDDLHSVLAYYLRYKAEVDAYVQEQERLGDEWQRKLEAEFPQKGLREKLLARLSQKP